MSNMRPASQSHKRMDSDGCSCQSTGSEESCSLTDEYPSDATTSSTRSSMQGPGGRGAPHTVLSGWNFYSSHHQSRTPHKNGQRHHSQERTGKVPSNHNHRRCSSGSSNHSKRMDSGYNGGSGSVHEGTSPPRTTAEILNGSQEPFFLHEPNMTSDDRVKKLFDNKKGSKDETGNNNNNVNGSTNGSQIVTVEVHHSSASEDSNSISDVSDPIPDYDDQGSQSSSTGNNNTTTNGRHRTKKTSREVSSLSTDEGIYHGEDDDEVEEDEMDDDVHRLIPHHTEDEEDDEDELHDNEVSFSPHHQEDLVAIRNKRPPVEVESFYGRAPPHSCVSRRASNTVDAVHDDSKKMVTENSNGTPNKETGTMKTEKTLQADAKKRGPTNNQGRHPSSVRKAPEMTSTSQPIPPPPPMPVKNEPKPVVKPPSPPPLPKSNKAKSEEETLKAKAPPPPPPPDLLLRRDAKLLDTSKTSTPDDCRSQTDDDRASQKSDESSSVDGSEGKRYVKATASRRNSHQRTLPFIPPQFSFPPDTNENIRPSEYLKQTKSGGSKNSTLKSNSTLHRAVSMGELAMSSKPEKISYGNRTESHETLLDSDSRSHLVQSPIESENGHSAVTGTKSNGNTPLFNITVEQLQTVHLKKTDKPNTPERTVLLQKNDLIAELKQTKDIQGVRKMKEERCKMDDVITADMAQTFKAENFVDQIPEVDTNGCVIPPWKRQMLAKKAAEKAKKEAEEQRIREAEAKKLNAIPPWKRQLLQRKDPPSPVTVQNIHRPVSQPVIKTPEPVSPPVQETVPPESQPNGDDPEPASASPTNLPTQNEDPEDIPPNPWLQQLRKTKSVFR